MAVKALGWWRWRRHAIRLRDELRWWRAMARFHSERVGIVERERDEWRRAYHDLRQSKRGAR